MATGQRAFQGETPHFDAGGGPAARTSAAANAWCRPRHRRWTGLCSAVCGRTATIAIRRWLTCVVALRGDLEAIEQMALDRGWTGGSGGHHHNRNCADSGAQRRGRSEVILPKAVQLTADQGASGDPSLSPDGKWLAYVSDRGNTGKWGIWIQRLDGSESRKLAECRVCSYPVFTPDGEKIIYACGSSPQETDLYLISAKGGESSLLAKDGQSPSISPDGRYVAYLDPKSRRYAVRPISGGEPVRLPVTGSLGGQYGHLTGNNYWSSEMTRKFRICHRDGGTARKTHLREATGQGWS